MKTIRDDALQTFRKVQLNADQNSGNVGLWLTRSDAEIATSDLNRDTT